MIITHSPVEVIQINIRQQGAAPLEEATRMPVHWHTWIWCPSRIHRQFYILEGTLIISDVMNKSKSALAFIFIGMLIILFSLYAAAATPSVYRVWVNDYYGFYQVRNIEPGNISFKYENNTLNIDVGDKVIWENQADNNYELTIISEQNLWDSKSGYLKYNYRSFNYTFMQPGTYQISVKEEPRLRHQTIIVAPVETPVVTTLPPTPTVTETAAPTVSVSQTPRTATPGLDIWYILIAFIVVAGLVVFIYSLKKK
jgi:plastocyanin